MKLSLSAVLAAAVLAAASPLPRSDPTGVVGISFERVALNATTRVLSRDSGPVGPVPAQNVLDQGPYMYVATLQVGTPPQSVRTALDTGSWDMWVYANSFRPGFDQLRSRTYKVTKKGGYSMQYNTQNWAKGDRAVDTVAIGGASLHNQDLAVVTSTNLDIPEGVLGIGLTTPGSKYPPNVPVQLKQQGHIKRNAYSLFLNDFSATAGSILFGGVDTAKFTGKLVRVKFGPDKFSGPYSYGVDVTIAGQTFEALFDSGSPISRLPTTAWKRFLQGLGKQVDLHTDDRGRYYVNGSESLRGHSFEIGIAGHTFQVPYSELFADDDGSGRYLLLALDAQSETTELIVGAGFLRALYVVFDNDGRNVYVGQAKYTTDSHIVSIPADGVPSDLVY